MVLNSQRALLMLLIPQKPESNSSFVVNRKNAATKSSMKTTAIINLYEI